MSTALRLNPSGLASTSVPFFAMSTTRNGRIGVIGTAGTIGSRAYQDMLEVNERLTVFAQACPRFVEFVESGACSSIEQRRIFLGAFALPPSREIRHR